MVIEGMSKVQKDIGAATKDETSFSILRAPLDPANPHIYRIGWPFLSSLEFVK